MFKKIAFVCVLVLAMLRAVAANASVSSIMIDAENGDVMYEMNADERPNFHKLKSNFQKYCMLSL